MRGETKNGCEGDYSTGWAKVVDEIQYQDSPTHCSFHHVMPVAFPFLIFLSTAVLEMEPRLMARSSPPSTENRCGLILLPICRFLLNTLPSRPRTGTSLLVSLFHLTSHAFCKGFSCHSPGLQAGPLQKFYLLVLSCLTQRKLQNLAWKYLLRISCFLFLSVKLSVNTGLKRFVHTCYLEQLPKARCCLIFIVYMFPKLKLQNL